MTECSRQTCFAPDTGCDLGHLDRSKCPAWKGSAPSGDSASDTEDLLLPWSGSALGVADLAFIGGRSKPIVIGIVGPQSAGKTTLLAAWYLLLGRGLFSNNRLRIAGSYTLTGWEAVANTLRWHPGQVPKFPPHTSSRGGRAPGLLHLSYRNEENRLKDVLFTDAPGEWFQKWAINRDSAESEGGRWVAEYADAFIVIADRDALSGPNLGPARGTFDVIANRLAAERGGRNVALVWTKSDFRVTPEVETAVRQSVKRRIPDSAEYSVSIMSSGDSDGTSFLAVLDWALGVKHLTPVLLDPESENSDPLFIVGSGGR